MDPSLKVLTEIFSTVENLELSTFFEEGCFPAAVLDRQALYRDEIIRSILRPEAGDVPFDKFVPRDDFRFVCVTSAAEPPPRTAARMAVIRVTEDVPRRKGREAEAGRKELLSAFGLKETKRNSKDLVEAAFEGDLDAIKAFVEKGYHIDSEDRGGHTALSEAACAGKIEVVSWLLEQGADARVVDKKQGRTALFRAAYHGHSDVVEILLAHGADPDQRTISAQPERPQDVAKTDRLRDTLAQWERSAALHGFLITLICAKPTFRLFRILVHSHTRHY